MPELYIHGLAYKDFDVELRGLLGEKALISAGTVARLKDKWHAELTVWRLTEEHPMPLKKLKTRRNPAVRHKASIPDVQVHIT